MDAIELLGIKITTQKEEEILEYITKSLEDKSKKYFITTPNPEILVYANEHSGFKNILNAAEIALPDGMGVVWASSILKKDIKIRITGVEMMEKICERFAKRSKTVGFLGGMGGVAEKTSLCLRKKYPNLIVEFAGEEWNQENFKVREIDILFVAFGFPKQEEWIYNNLHKIPVRIAMCVGGSFDYISGKVPRAPEFLRRVGLEWFFRLVIQPWRIRRQIKLIKFVYLVFKEKLHDIKNTIDL